MSLPFQVLTDCTILLNAFTLKLHKHTIHFNFALELQSFNWKSLKVEADYISQRLEFEGSRSQILVNVKRSSSASLRAKI
jgi:hypothetical protein